MFSCDHCQKKYKRSWHQVRHSQMKHENSNASTATTSSAGTPPTPEVNSRTFSTPDQINGAFGSPEMNGAFASPPSEMNGNNTPLSTSDQSSVGYYNYQPQTLQTPQASPQMQQQQVQPIQQVPHMPSHTIMPDMNQNPTPYYPNQQQMQSQQNCMTAPLAEPNAWSNTQHAIPQQLPQQYQTYPTSNTQMYPNYNYGEYGNLDNPVNSYGATAAPDQWVS